MHKITVGSTQTLCGKPPVPGRKTTVDARVTCTACLRIMFMRKAS